jgi:hypothetical protein
MGLSPLGSKTALKNNILQFCYGYMPSEELIVNENGCCWMS